MHVEIACKFEQMFGYRVYVCIVQRIVRCCVAILTTSRRRRQGMRPAGAPVLSLIDKIALSIYFIWKSIDIVSIMRISISNYVLYRIYSNKFIYLRVLNESVIQYQAVSRIYSLLF